MVEYARIKSRARTVAGITRATNRSGRFGMNSAEDVEKAMQGGFVVATGREIIVYTEGENSAL